jgi:hypothetical protein
VVSLYRVRFTTHRVEKRISNVSKNIIPTRQALPGATKSTPKGMLYSLMQYNHITQAMSILFLE